MFYQLIQPFQGFSALSFGKVSIVLFKFVMDPIVFTLTLKPLRTAVAETFGATHNRVAFTWPDDSFRLK